MGNTATGMIHVRLTAFLSERKGWFYTRSTTTGIINERLDYFNPKKTMVLTRKIL